MKKTWKKNNNKIYQKNKIKKILSFSISKNKGWKKKWEIKRFLAAAASRRRFSNRRKLINKWGQLRKFRRYENIFRSQFIKKKRFFRKLHFLSKIIKQDYNWNFNEWCGDLPDKNKLCVLINNPKLSKNKKIIKKKLFFIKKYIIKTTKYFFKRSYKKKINYNFNKYFKPLLLKNLNMSLAKFSLITNITWYDFNGLNQHVWADYFWDYGHEKSKQIKFFFDMFIQKNLLAQIQNIKILRSHRLFQHIHKQKIFSDFWNKKRKFPWWEILMFKQQIYNYRLSWKSQQFWFRGRFLPFSFKFYYRYKKPWREKKKHTYSNFAYLIFNNEHQNVISNKKQKRIKELLNKILLPFYGNIKPKQIRSLYHKNHYVQSQLINSSNLLLNNLENRLDVVVYRLNLAPSIIWARRLIRAGLIFLQRAHSKKTLVMNNFFQKKNLYPLQLNKLFDYYTLLSHDLRIKKFLFRALPILKTNLKIQPGDIIQCHPFSLYQKWNMSTELLNKPVPPYLLTKTKITIDNEWNPRYRYIIRDKKYLLLYGKKKRWWRKSFNLVSYRYEWNDGLLKETTSFFLFTPQKKDFFPNDRNASLFLNWIIK